jgi:rhamnogalacturonan endolyase
MASKSLVSFGLRNLSLLPLLAVSTFAALTATEDASKLDLSNERLYASVNKSTGAIGELTLDGQDLLDSASSETPTLEGTTGNRHSSIGLYLDCYCIPSGSFTPGGIAPRYKLFKGVDSTKVVYRGVVMSETYPPTGQTLEQ